MSSSTQREQPEHSWSCQSQCFNQMLRGAQLCLVTEDGKGTRLNGKQPRIQQKGSGSCSAVSIFVPKKKKKNTTFDLQSDAID